jgi:hypothetical protein
VIHDFLSVKDALIIERLCDQRFFQLVFARWQSRIVLIKVKEYRKNINQNA